MRILLVLLFVFTLGNTAGVSIYSGLTKTTSLVDSSYFIVKKNSADSVAKKVAWGTFKDSIRVYIGDSTRTDSGSFLDTLTGLTTVVTGTIKYYKNGNNVSLLIPAQTGTSNTTAATFTTLPTAIRPTTAQFVSIVGNVQDNGTTTNGHVSIGTDGVMTLYFGASAPSATFTNSGTKGWTNAMVISYILF